MFLYKVTYHTGNQVTIRANSPREAWNIAQVWGIVAHVKFVK